MNGLLLLGLSALILVVAYLFYGRYLVKTWGIDPKATTPAVAKEDGTDFVPTNKWSVFAHQFSSIAGAGPVTGPVMAMMFGWLPAFLWVIVGGVFFGAVQDFGALYASVKTEGKSMGQIIEKYIGRKGKKLFFLFCWIFTLIVIAAFADMVAGTFNGISADGAKLAPNASAASISILYVFVAMAFGLFLKKVKLEGLPKVILGIALIIAMLALGIMFPVYATKTTWIYVVFVYIFFASVTPMWLLKTPRDYLTTFLFIGMIVAAVIGVFVSNPTITTPAFIGFKSASGSYIFPTLFVTIACGAVSGFHSLVSSETSSKLVENEKDMLQVGYGSMLLESLLAILVIVIVGALPNLKASGVLDSTLANMALADTATPFTKFSAGVTGLVAQLGLPQSWGLCIMTMFVSALALTSLDAVARISRMSFQEFFEVEEGQEPSGLVKVLTNKYVSTIISLVCGYLLSLGGYVNIWPLFGSANQLLAAMVLISLAVFLKVTGRKGFMLYIPMVLMFIVTMTALVQAIYGIVMKLFVTGGFVLMVDGLQLVVAILLVALGLMIGFNSGSKLVKEK
ncbi:carbon starvation protein A [Faecalibacillus intestinalis]|uniref:Carbon starvation protein A n=1 Tax=Faecalibacillus intestinalis TaxID=1982626 RepID=A0AAP2XL31_9FIRM|nr:carbon starvation protein A [Faecalibacillus intestinalis]MCB8591856.1 carbon starvation protein A [Faecalibacillus intestinalis]MCB8612877.1 carbon starvation protein A [Faecalibacillus intestinalis]MCG4680381.1 carbon starvation protein A [Faecalibacillus intestinalis]MCG4713310.1 carbon starvation protein A [Faecalibacillus intestinalis]MCG4754524.1 carbon starvation protein A [Faecalibacillus intestinalis]